MKIETMTTAAPALVPMTILAFNEFSSAADLLGFIVASLLATSTIKHATLVQHGPAATHRRGLDRTELAATLALILFAQGEVGATIQFLWVVLKVTTLGRPDREWEKNGG